MPLLSNCQPWRNHDTAIGRKTYFDSRRRARFPIATGFVVILTGATTSLAEDGVEALEKMASMAPDLMICDLEMPRMDGLMLVENLRNEGYQTPILVISATENMADIAKALRLGVQDILLKPVKDLNRLRETVLACLYPNMFNSRVEEEERLFGTGML